MKSERYQNNDSDIFTEGIQTIRDEPEKIYY